MMIECARLLLISLAYRQQCQPQAGISGGDLSQPKAIEADAMGWSHLCP